MNRHGALVLSPRPYDLGTPLRMRNLESGQRVACRVVWAGGSDDGGNYKLGVEFSEERPDNWGPEYKRAIPEEERDAG